MAIYDLKANLDLKQNMNIYATCKQLDNLNLILYIYDNSVQVDLSSYTVRLKAMKADKVPLVQEHTGISISGNIITIETDEQLTTTSGKTLIELQFIDNSTGKKKATFNLVLIVIASTLADGTTISKSTYTLLEELENKMDQASNFFENIDEAITANNNLQDSIYTGNTLKTNLDNNITTGNTLNNDLETNISAGNILKPNLEGAVTSANTAKAELDISIQDANTFVSEHGDIIDLDNRVTQNTSQLNDTAKLTILNSNAKNPLYTPTPDGSGQAVHPKVLFFPSGWGTGNYQYYMAMTPYKDTDDAYENPCILVSRNGYEFFVPAGLTNPIDTPTQQEIIDGAHMSDTHLVVVGNTMECWYRYNPPLGNGRPDNNTNIIYKKTSTDGINWSDRVEIMRSPNGLLSPCVIYKDNKYLLWYVNYDKKLYYRESTDGISWTNETQCDLSVDNYSLWHLDIINTSGYYETVVCCNQPSIDSDKMLLFYSTSENGVNWTKSKLVMQTSQGQFDFDNKSVYRSSIVKINGFYKLYYSANKYSGSGVGTWNIGLSQGYNIFNLNGYDSMTNYLEHTFLEDFKVLLGKRFLTGDISYLKNDELKLGNKGVASVLLKSITNDDLLSVRKGNDSDLGDIETRKSTTREDNSKLYKVIDDSGNLCAYINKTGFYFANSPTKFEDNLLSLVNKGVTGAKLKVETKSDTISVKNDSNSSDGFIECGGVYFNNSNIQNIEGAIRYNSTTKKHQGYNGTTWNDLY